MRYKSFFIYLIFILEIGHASPLFAQAKDKTSDSCITDFCKRVLRLTCLNCLVSPQEEESPATDETPNETPIIAGDLTLPDENISPSSSIATPSISLSPAQALASPSVLTPVVNRTEALQETRAFVLISGIRCRLSPGIIGSSAYPPSEEASPSLSGGGLMMMGCGSGVGLAQNSVAPQSRRVSIDSPLKRDLLHRKVAEVRKLRLTTMIRNLNLRINEIVPPPEVSVPDSVLRELKQMLLSELELVERSLSTAEDLESLSLIETQIDAIISDLNFSLKNLAELASIAAEAGFKD